MIMARPICISSEFLHGGSRLMSIALNMYELKTIVDLKDAKIYLSLLMCLDSGIYR